MNQNVKKTAIDIFRENLDQFRAANALLDYAKGLEHKLERIAPALPMEANGEIVYPVSDESKFVFSGISVYQNSNSELFINKNGKEYRMSFDKETGYLHIACDSIDLKNYGSCHGVVLR